MYYVGGKAVWRNTAGFTCNNGVVSNTYTTFQDLFTVPVAPEPERPGPDMVPIPDTAVMGTFTEVTSLLYVPDEGAATGALMFPGQSLWVFGLDESGEFYEVLLSGLTYWVPRGSIGPTFPPPWNGKPLPVD